MDIRQFTDATGKAWPIKIVWSTFRDIKAATGIDLETVLPKKADDKAASLQPLNDIVTDPMTFFGVLCAVLKPQDQDAFGASLDGNAFADAGLAFIEALSDFFRDSFRGQVLRKATAVMRAASNRIRKEFDKLDVDKIVNEAADEALKKLSGDQPVPPA